MHLLRVAVIRGIKVGPLGAQCCRAGATVCLPLSPAPGGLLLRAGHLLCEHERLFPPAPGSQAQLRPLALPLLSSFSSFLPRFEFLFPFLGSKAFQHQLN